LYMATRRINGNTEEEKMSSKADGNSAQNEETADAESRATTFDIVFYIIFYSACSSSLLLVNRMVIKVMPLHSFVSCAQFIFASGAIIGFKCCGFLDFDYLDVDKAKVYGIYVLTFMLGLYSNMRALEETTVETVIVFRACCPIVVAFMDYLFLGRAFPSCRSIFSMLVIMGGALGYVLSDKQFEVGGVMAYIWVIAWFTCLCFNMTYGKLILQQVKSQSIWESVYYNNLLTLLPMFLLGVGAGEWDKAQHIEVENVTKTYTLLALSCVAGLGIGYAGWKCRSLVSAASYTLVGVVNKVFTVIMSLMLTDDTATSFGLMCLFIAILGSAFYQQAPKLQTKSMSSHDEEQQIEVQPLKKV